MNKTFKILEIIWMIMGCIGILMCIYSIAISDTKGALYFLAFFAVCGIMFAVRKRQRIRFEEAQKKNLQ